jgi:DNA polymerase-3 subunit beta
VLRVVATDGHRLAFQELPIAEDVTEHRQVIVPRKGVLELMRLLADSEAEVMLRFGANHIRLAWVTSADLQADRRQVPRLPAGHPRDPGRTMIADRHGAARCPGAGRHRAHDKTQGIRLQLEDWTLRAQRRTPSRRRPRRKSRSTTAAVRWRSVSTSRYLLDALGALGGELAKLSFNDAGSSCLIEESEGGGGKHVIMPMRL